MPAAAGGGRTRPARRQTTQAAGPADVVILPDLIVDLFPNPTEQRAGGRRRSRRARRSRRRFPTIRRCPSAAPRGTRRLSLVAAPPTVAPRAITGAFVPDEVLVTVDGDPAVVADLAATFGLEVRSQRQSLLLGVTVVRFGIPDGRPVGVVLAQLAGDGRTRARTPNHIYDLQQAAGMVELRLPATSRSRPTAPAARMSRSRWSTRRSMRRIRR